MIYRPNGYIITAPNGQVINYSGNYAIAKQVAAQSGLPESAISMVYVLVEPTYKTEPDKEIALYEPDKNGFMIEVKE